MRPNKNKLLTSHSYELRVCVQVSSSAPADPLQELLSVVHTSWDELNLVAKQSPPPVIRILFQNSMQESYSLTNIGAP